MRRGGEREAIGGLGITSPLLKHTDMFNTGGNELPSETKHLCYDSFGISGTIVSVLFG